MPTPPTLFVLLDGQNPYDAVSFGDAGVPDIEGLTRALAASPAWASMPEAVLFVRRAPRPTIAVLGRFDGAANERLKALRGQLHATLNRFRYVSYGQAERACEVLAGRLRDRFGRDEVQRFHFSGIPRGGLMVLGMLSYTLELEHSQLEPPHPPDAPLVVVDDCALTGSRFGRFLERCESERVIFTPLYAHPELRAAIVNEETRVTACLSAEDLHDHGPERLGEDYPSWRKRWAQRTNGPRYWIGEPDHVCFPWSEPDMGVWNPTAERVEGGWRVVPPKHCLKNRSFSDEEPHVPVQRQPEGNGPLKPASHVLFGTFDGVLVVADIDAKTTYRFTGSAADMWRALVEHGTMEDAKAALLNTFDVAETTLATDLRAFVDDLHSKDLLKAEEQHAQPVTS